MEVEKYHLLEGNSCTDLFCCLFVLQYPNYGQHFKKGPAKTLSLSSVTRVIYPGPTPVNQGQYLLIDETSGELLWIYCIETEQILLCLQWGQLTLVMMKKNRISESTLKMPIERGFFSCSF